MLSQGGSRLTTSEPLLLACTISTKISGAGSFFIIKLKFPFHVACLQASGSHEISSLIYSSKWMKKWLPFVTIGTDIMIKFFSLLFLLQTGNTEIKCTATSVLVYSVLPRCCGQNSHMTRPKHGWALLACTEMFFCLQWDSDNLSYLRKKKKLISKRNWKHKYFVVLFIFLAILMCDIFII